MISLYNKKVIRIIRIISIICICFLLFVNINWLLHNDTLSLNINIYFFILNWLVILLDIFIIIVPEKFIIIASVFFLYSVLILIIQPGNAIGLLLYFLGIVLLYSRGKCPLKIANFLLVILLLISFTGIFLHSNKIVITSLYVILYIFLQGLLLFIAFYSDKTVSEKNSLVLTHYKGLTKRDERMLKGVQARLPYKTIAADIGLSEGSVKNRLRLVYSILEVGDKTGFLNRYSDSEIIYDDIH